MLALLPLRVHDKHRGVLTTQLCSSSYACPLRGLLWRRTSEAGPHALYGATHQSLSGYGVGRRPLPVRQTLNMSLHKDKTAISAKVE